ncbi:MAG: response regulator [Sulfurimonas sp.]|nr:response regulator [Sulfurimonas sp.]
MFKEVIVGVDGIDGISLYYDYKTATKEYIDIVISDIKMPNMDGITLSKEIYRINPKQKIIIISSYNETNYFIELIKIGISGFIKKPLSLTEVIDIIYEVCMQLCNDKELNRYIEFSKYLKWDNKFKILFNNNIEIALTMNEINLMNLLVNNLNKKFTDLDIFNHIYYNNPEKEFSIDVIKGLLKRLRKKIPKNLIKNNPKQGYSIKDN